MSSAIDHRAVYPQLPVQMVYLTPFFDIMGGGTVILTSFIYEFVADTVDPEHLCVYTKAPVTNANNVTEVAFCTS